MTMNFTSLARGSGPSENVPTTETATGAQRRRRRHVGDHHRTTTSEDADDDPEHTDPHQSDGETERHEQVRAVVSALQRPHALTTVIVTHVDVRRRPRPEIVRAVLRQTASYARRS